MKELERRALLGDKQAQRDCTEKGIVLPCSWCKKVPAEEDIFPDYAGWIIYHDCKIAGHMRVKAKTRFDLILKWNTRPEPPIGRCKDCAYKQKASVNDKGFLICPASGVEITDYDFCGYFEEVPDEAAHIHRD